MKDDNKTTSTLSGMDKGGTTYYIITTEMIIDLIKKELNSTQIEEIGAMINKEEDRSKWVGLISEKIKTYGEEVSHKILTKLICHPVIISGLIEQTKG
jgi:hypothetical protein